ncbi:MAG: hypothetical protein O7F09_07200 [Chloroflexi bacterium]|nr:hypothetical protein [Chloroflexota bacterium]MCZ6892283.1 hypothetical protein [Chloroflexota bacterium]
MPIAEGRLLLKEDDVDRYWSHQLEEEERTDRINGKEEPHRSRGLLVKRPPVEADAIPWRWGHERCLPESRYVVIAKRFENMGQLVDWTHQLLNDALFTKTNWRETLRRFYHLPAA